MAVFLVEEEEEEEGEEEKEEEEVGVVVKWRSDGARGRGGGV